MQFSASASSTLDPDIPSPSDGSVPLVHVNPAFGCRVCSSPLPVSGCRCRERRGGEEVQTGRPAWITKTRVLPATNRCCMHGRQFNVDGDVSRFSWPLLSETPFGWFNSGLTRHASPPLPLHCRLTPSGPSPAACWLQVLTAAAAFWSCIMTLGHRRVRQFAYRGRGSCAWVDEVFTWLAWVVDFHPEFC